MTRIHKRLVATVLYAAALGVLAGTSVTCGQPEDPERAMNEVAEDYVKLVLAVGVHEENYVDAYSGPKEWRRQAVTDEKPLDVLRFEAARTHAALLDLAIPDTTDEAVRLRHQYLTRQIESLLAYVDFLDGTRVDFDAESKALYDAVAPTHSPSHFQGILDQLDEILPGAGSLSARLETFRRDFVIPKEKLDTVFQAAIEEARKRTKLHMELPANERFELEYVHDKPWSGYNWFQGDGRSLIQLNTDLPFYIDRAIDLACHEGYPGHHVYNVLLERHLLKERGWIEFCVYALFSPQSLIAEGTGNYGIQVAFPGDERLAFEKDMLYPLAGLDPDRAQDYARVEKLVEQLSYAGNEAARGYLDGKMSRDQAIDWLMKYVLHTRERAAQRVDFFDKYRSYVINYNLGEDLVKNYIEARGGTADAPQKRWQEFHQLISSPRLPSHLVAGDKR